ncbi:erythromycin esterase family protein [Streptomyces griseocarneus]|uniref:erythromycin esterase family protein n=1 Tax=Streptomyces griseocarneus TaxID=51201 RepID=UPI00167E368C|nr:erythromycin esterase family protein [Streptomyces griseocarneus]MBZ6474284.1 erythromycin esterase family protein [Streptomyces griseocarneus]
MAHKAPHLRQRHRASSALAALLLCAGVSATAVAQPAAASPAAARPAASAAEQGAADPVAALTRAAYPLRTTEPGGDLRDLRPLGRMIGDAGVVGLGEATHSSHEFFTNKHRVLRYLVEEKGFTAFALEAPWSTGLRIDDYVVHGKGDPQQIMKEEFQRDYGFWNTREYLDLIKWMRQYNIHHEKKVHFVGDDIGHAGPRVFDEVTRYVAEHHPGLRARFAELYRGQRPADGTSVGDRMKALLQRPLAERKDMADRSRRALELLSAQRPAAGRAQFDLAVQHARNIAQVAGQYAYDLNDTADVTRAMLYRDEQMAANVAWWREHTGGKVLLSAHNAHVAYVSDDERYPKVQGAFLRDRLGKDYVNVRLTFDAGSFNATTDPEETKIEVCTVGSAGPGSNEHTLDRVPYRDYVLDMRTAPAAARAWLNVARPTRNIGTAYPEPLYRTALAPSYDVLIHLHRVTAARLLPGATG